MIKSKIITHKNEFTSSEKQIAKYILDNFNKDTSSLTITQLSQKIHVSNAALTRFCQKIRTNGFKEFQYLMIQELKDNHSTSESRNMNEIIQSLKNTDKSLDPSDLTLVSKAIWRTKNVFVYGEAFTHIMAQTLSRKFNKINIPSQVYNVASDLGVILPKEHSVHIFISTSGRNPNIEHAVKKISSSNAKKQMIVSLTAGEYSNIEQYENAHIHGEYVDSGIGDPHELPTVGFHIIQYISDTLFEEVYNLNKKSNDEIIFNLSSERDK